jgi:hypothetical protein
MNIYKLFSKKRESKSEELFNDIIGYYNIKRLFSMALDSDEQVSIILSGPPACISQNYVSRSFNEA